MMVGNITFHELSIFCDRFLFFEINLDVRRFKITVGSLDFVREGLRGVRAMFQHALEVGQ